MIGIGPLEILVLLVVALLVIGPEKMPEVARAVARLMRELRGAMDEVRGQFDEIAREDLFDTKEIESYYRDTIDGVKKAVEPPEILKESVEGVKKDLEEFGKDVDDSIKQIDKPTDKKTDKPAPEPSPEPPSEPNH